MSWKDYFYFQKGDKAAVVLLLSLITIAGSIYIATKPPTDILGKKEKTIELTSLSENENQPKIVTRNIITYPSKLKQGETIEINRADTSGLKKIPGIGSTYANRIVKYRSLLGGFDNISQLSEVWGIDDKLLSDIKPYIVIEPGITRLNINSATFKELLRHPYLNYDQVKVIVDVRKRKGKIESVNRLALLDEFTENDLKKLAPYLSFE